ncbi:MAG TPA: type IV toxin-antitoxin system AbiEi family antitoxin [Candidatus Angelobacter sp.]|nr:type IV toxin-antitoxin system AbiEi family antitoxin [Candidatus Angelobacter sp.]
MPRREQAARDYIDKISTLDFIRRHELSQPREGHGINPSLAVWTPKGKFTFLVELKGSYFDRSSLNAFISQAKHLTRVHHKPLLLFARYLPEPSAELLISAGINFVDQVGNMHLALGDSYVRTVIGRKEKSTNRESAAATPAMIQLLFTFAIYSDAGSWTVRQLADASGVSKSSVAKIKQQMLEQGLLRAFRGIVQIANADKMEDELLRGYGSILRPKLLIGRFRAAQADPEKLIRNISEVAHDLSIEWSLTGTAAAHELQHFYQGLDIPVFIAPFSEQFSRTLRIIPDASGPLVLLRSVGTLAHWKEIGQKPLAHPWLIYAELMYSADPRAHEAAQEIKREFLSGQSSSVAHDADSENLKLAHELNVIRTDIQRIRIINHLFPALHKLRIFLHAHPALLKIADNEAFDQKWLRHPNVEMNMALPSSRWNNQTLAELHADIEKLRLK